MVPLHRKNIFTANHGTFSIYLNLLNYEAGRQAAASAGLEGSVAGDGASDGSR
jgi:hypothetical protein